MKEKTFHPKDVNGKRDWLMESHAWSLKQDYERECKKEE